MKLTLAVDNGLKVQRGQRSLCLRLLSGCRRYPTPRVGVPQRKLLARAEEVFPWKCQAVTKKTARGETLHHSAALISDAGTTEIGPKFGSNSFEKVWKNVQVFKCAFRYFYIQKLYWLFFFSLHFKSGWFQNLTTWVGIFRGLVSIWRFLGVFF